MSVRRLLIPSRTTLRWILGAGPPGPGDSGPSGPPGAPPASGAVRSRTDEYSEASQPWRTTTLAAFQANPHSCPVAVSAIGPLPRTALGTHDPLCPDRVAPRG